MWRFWPRPTSPAQHPIGAPHQADAARPGGLRRYPRYARRASISEAHLYKLRHAAATGRAANSGQNRPFNGCHTAEALAASGMLGFEPCLEHQHVPKVVLPVTRAALVLLPLLTDGRRIEKSLAAQPGVI